MQVDEALDVLTAEPARTGIFTDFDGTLSEIVDRPDDAVAIDGAPETLTSLAQRFELVAVVSGRSLDDLAARLPVDGVVLAGSYGRERSDRSGGRRPVEGWEAVALAAANMVAELPGAVLERKGAGVALHYRMDPSLEADVRERADLLAAEFELDVLPGRLVVELVRPGPNKGDAVATLAAEHELATVFIAGDDVADLDAFRWAREAQVRSVLVGVGSEEAPPDLGSATDLIVAGPRELLAFLRRLAEAD